MGVQVLADRGVGVFPGFGNGSRPRVEHRPRAQLAASFEGGIATCVRRVKHVAHRLGIPSLNIGHRQHHRSGRTRLPRNMRRRARQGRQVDPQHPGMHRPPPLANNF